MNKILIIAFVILTSLSNAQEFAPNGATWHYEVINGGGQQLGFIKIIADGDTTINNLTYRKIKRNQNLFLLLREESDKVYWYHAPTNSDRIFFDRNPTVGDIWNFPYDDPFEVNFPYEGNFTNPIDSMGLKVESILDTTFNNLPAKRIQFSKRLSANEAFIILPNDFQSSYLAYTPFGFFQTFFLLGAGALLDNEFPVRLRCYEDAYWGLIHFNPAIACDIIVQLMSISDFEANQAAFEIYPNPASDYLALHFNEQQGKSYHISITDMQGRVLHNKICVYDSIDSIISLQSYASGTYLLHIQQNGKQVGSKIFVKQ
jgi:hypothetical protein